MNKTVTIVASGYSLKDFDFTKLKGDIFAINYMYKYCNFTKLFCWDSLALKRFMQVVDNKKIVTTTLAAGIHNAKEVQSYERDIFAKGIVREKGKVIHYNSTVAFCINVAIQLGYKKIILLGCDNDYRGDRFHFYDKVKLDKIELKKLPGFFKMFNRFYKRISEDLNPDEKIITVDSSIPYFENISMEEYLSKFGK